MPDTSDAQDNIWAALHRIKGSMRRRHSDSIRADIAIAMSELDHLLDPRAAINGATRPARGDVCPAVQLGIGIPKVRDTRLSVSEAKALFNRGEHHAAEQALQLAIERWGVSD